MSVPYASHVLRLIPELPSLPPRSPRPASTRSALSSTRSDMSPWTSQVSLPIKITPTKTFPSTPQGTSGKTQDHVSPSVSKVNELSERKRTRAHSTASTVEEELDNGEAREIFLRIQAFKENNSLRLVGGLGRDFDEEREIETTPTDVSKSRQHNTLPDVRSALVHPPARLVVSVPAVSLTKVPPPCTQPVPVSPIGNAWSGAHFWEPQFSPTSAIPNTSCELSVSLPTPEEAAYAYVKGEIDTLARSIFEETKESEAIERSECELIAAERTLVGKNAEYERSFEYPSPTSMALRIFTMAAEERRLLTDFAVKTHSQLLDVDHWLDIEGETDLNDVILEFSKGPSYKFRTILDHVKETLKMLRQRRKSVHLELSTLAYSMVFALQIFEEKLWQWQAGGDSSEGSSGDENEYGTFLKSISEELASSSLSRIAPATTVLTTRSGSLNWKKVRLRRSLDPAERIREEPEVSRLESRSRIDTSQKRSIVDQREDPSPLGLKIKRNSLAQVTATLEAEEASPSELKIRRNSLAMVQAPLGEKKEHTSPKKTRTRREVGGGLNGPAERRLKGKAPSVLDLASWAQELQKLDEEEKEVGMAITKDD